MFDLRSFVFFFPGELLVQNSVKGSGNGDGKVFLLKITPQKRQTFNTDPPAAIIGYHMTVTEKGGGVSEVGEERAGNRVTSKSPDVTLTLGSFLQE